MSSIGLASGLDIKSLVSQLMAIERRPVLRLEKKIGDRKSQLTVYSDLRTKLEALKATVSGMKSLSSFSKITAASSDEDFATVSATGEAQAGAHTLKISQLATAAKSVTQGFSSEFSSIGTGTFTITIGSDTVDITVDSSNNTLAGLRDSINASDSDVTATIVNDGDASIPYRLVISSDETGTDYDHTISVADWIGDTVDFTKGGVDPGQAAQDALFTFDGISITKSSNEVDDLIDGVTIYLKDASDSSKVINLDFTSNVSEVKDNIQAFLDSYNATVDYISQKLKTKTMRSDFAFSGIRSKLNSLISDGVPFSGGVYTSLSQIGIRTSGGKLSIDSKTLNNALEDYFDDVVKLFTTQGNTSGQYVNFINSTVNTASGQYAVEITDLGSSVSGTIGGYAANSYSGNFLIGAEGTPVQGMMIQFTGSSTGSYGNVNFSVGLMENFERNLNNYLKGSGSLLSTREARINSAISSYETLIETKERSLRKTERVLNAKFIRMEQLVQQLQVSQGALAALTTMRFF